MSYSYRHQSADVLVQYFHGRSGKTVQSKIRRSVAMGYTLLHTVLLCSAKFCTTLQHCSVLHRTGLLCYVYVLYCTALGHRTRYHISLRYTLCLVFYGCALYSSPMFHDTFSIFYTPCSEPYHDML